MNRRQLANNERDVKLLTGNRRFGEAFIQR